MRRGLGGGFWVEAAVEHKEHLREYHQYPRKLISPGLWDGLCSQVDLFNPVSRIQGYDMVNTNYNSCRVHVATFVINEAFLSHTLLGGYSLVQSVCVCVCVFCVVIPFVLDIRLVGGTSRGHTGFLQLPSAVLALILIARRTQPSLSLVDREVEFCVPTN